MAILQFIVERYNYWIFIILMMIGLYTVIARGNLVKKIIGLNIFQTSVFIYYISIGKIAGGTAPIYVPGDMERRTVHEEDHHGDGYNGKDHVATEETIRAKDHINGQSNDLHHGDALHQGDANELVTATGVAEGASGKVANLNAPALNRDLPANIHAGEANATIGAAPTSDKIANTASFNIKDSDAATGLGGEREPGLGQELAAASEIVANVLYSNPLPHVLILTAIVVGVATTAVGLSLAVRIREAYGTIEEDELETADTIAEFGKPDPDAPARAGAR